MIDIKTVKIILIILIVKKSNISLADKGNNQTVTPADPPKKGTGVSTTLQNNF